MKHKSLVVFLISCLIILVFLCTPSHHILKSGTISFKSMNAQKDAFTIRTTSIILPNTYIYFTDTEWNGTYFGIDEHTMIWNSGEDSIPAGSIIYFKSFTSHTITSIGSTQGILKIASKKEAIFAYQGTLRMPTHFIAGIAFNPSDYGTLENTGLIIDSTAFVLPQ